MRNSSWQIIYPQTKVILYIICFNNKPYNSELTKFTCFVVLFRSNLKIVTALRIFMSLYFWVWVEKCLQWVRSFHLLNFKTSLEEISQLCLFSFVLSYLMKTNRLTYKKALAKVNATRKKMFQAPVKPNHGFVRQLRQFEKKIGLKK